MSAFQSCYFLLPVSIGWVVNPSDDDDQKVMKAPAVSLDAPRRLPPPLCHIGQIACALGLNGRLVYISLLRRKGHSSGFRTGWTFLVRRREGEHTALPLAIVGHIMKRKDSPSRESALAENTWNYKVGWSLLRPYIDRGLVRKASRHEGKKAAV